MIPGRLWLILPAYNEADNLLPLIDAIRMAFESASEGYTIVLVNDGSTDGTAGIAAKYPGWLSLRVVNHPKNLGLAAAIRTGLFEVMKEAWDNDVVVFMDADNTHSPALICNMVQEIREGKDLVIASRYRSGARVIGLSAWRRFLSLSASLLFRVFHPMDGVRDYTCGFRMYRASLLRKAVEAYGERLIDRPAGFSVTVDLLLKLKRFSPVITEVPMVLHYDRKRGTSKMRILRNVGAVLPLILKRYR